MMTTNTAHTNRLINESSPYLQQHAHNPVDWYPWGSEAFEKAKKEDKPIFLSIGYSCCHWCHVMERESFEDEEAAKVLNKHFVSIKVDREERPDIDEAYMSVCQAMTGSGGWPLTIIMTPEKKPFFAGTYLPKETANGRMGLIELCGKVAELWKKDRGALEKSGDEITRLLSERPKRSREAADEERIIGKAFRQIENSFDASYGGFSQSPKFPTPHYLLFLLDYWKANGSFDALDMVEKTLACMYNGGIFDHVGGGFSRYSTDRKWLVPHFEKMLYDNALLLLAYTECYAATGSAKYRTVAEKTAEYLMRDMRSPEGGFYSAEDADSEGVEGKYYIWGYDELKELLSDDELKSLEESCGVTKRGNFEGANILNMIHPGSEPGEASGAALKKLYEARLGRVPPFKDTKISASWNGLAIEALARAGAVLGNQEYLDSAAKAADFVLNKMRYGGELAATYKDAKLSAKGFLADYANMCNALTALYIPTLDLKYLSEAQALVKDMLRLFWDEDDKRFYMTRSGDDELFTRPRDDYDGAMPSGNSSAAMCLLRLYDLTGAAWAKEAFDKAKDGFIAEAAASPTAHVHFVSALLLSSTPHRQAVISAQKASSEAITAYRSIISRFDPFASVIYYDRSPAMDEMFPELSQYKTDMPFAGYVCENFTCRKPVYSAGELMNELEI